MRFLALVFPCARRRSINHRLAFRRSTDDLIKAQDEQDQAVIRFINGELADQSRQGRI